MLRASAGRRTCSPGRIRPGCAKRNRAVSGQPRSGRQLTHSLRSGRTNASAPTQGLNWRRCFSWWVEERKRGHLNIRLQPDRFYRDFHLQRSPRF